MERGRWSLEGRLVLITGGSRGIGAAVARLAAERGASSVVNYRSNGEAAAAVVEEIRNAGGQAEAIQADVSVAESVKAMFRRLRELGGVDVLVNNAGVLRSALLGMTSEADFDEQLAINTKGTFLCMQQAAKQMARSGGGRIINCSSIVGRVGTAGHTAYAASKAAVIGMSLAAAKELAPRGITVNVVAPGLIDTDMTASFPDAVRHEILSSIPLGRAGRPEEVASLVVFLASQEAGYINGQVLGVDGGQMM